MEVGDERDGRAPPVSVRRKKEKREKGGAGPAGERIGPTWAVARAGEKERPLAWNGCGPKIEERERERERRRKGFPFSFKISFQITFKLQSNKLHAFES
jgi:hypothetical protein